MGKQKFKYTKCDFALFFPSSLAFSVLICNGNFIEIAFIQISPWLAFLNSNQIFLLRYSGLVYQSNFSQRGYSIITKTGDKEFASLFHVTQGMPPCHHASFKSLHLWQDCGREQPFRLWSWGKENPKKERVGGPYVQPKVMLP